MLGKFYLNSGTQYFPSSQVCIFKVTQVTHDQCQKLKVGGKKPQKLKVKEKKISHQKSH